MEQIYRIFAVSFIASLAALLLTAPQFIYAETDPEEMSLEHDILVIEGKVQDVSSENKTLTVKPNKAKAIVILMETETKTIGFNVLGELEKKQRIKVWYYMEEESYIAVKVEKFPDLGC